MAALNAREIFPPLAGVISKLWDFEICIQAARVVSPNVVCYTNHGRTITKLCGAYGSCGHNTAHNQMTSQYQ